MKIVDEPAEQVEAELRKDEIEVSREPYDPGSRNLLSDFVGFMRSPSPGSRVTLFEDGRGRVRYYAVTPVDPEVARLRTQVAELTRRGEHELPTLRLERIEKQLERVDALAAKLVKVDALAAVTERVPALEAKVAKIDELATMAEKLPDLQAKIGEMGEIRTRLERLERPRPG